MSKLSDAQVIRILRNIDHWNDRETAEIFAVTRICIWCIRTGKSWSHLRPDLPRRTPRPWVRGSPLALARQRRKRAASTAAPH